MREKERPHAEVHVASRQAAHGMHNMRAKLNEAYDQIMITEEHKAYASWRLLLTQLKKFKTYHRYYMTLYIHLYTLARFIFDHQLVNFRNGLLKKLIRGITKPYAIYTVKFTDMTHGVNCIRFRNTSDQFFFNSLFDVTVVYYTMKIH